MYKNSNYVHKISLSDKNTIRYLILNRITLDPLYNLNGNICMFYTERDVFSFNTDLKDVYISLDSIIEECRFKEKRMKLVNLLFEGYSISDICKLEKEFKISTTSRMFNRIVNSIVDMNSRMITDILNKSKK